MQQISKGAGRKTNRVTQWHWPEPPAPGRGCRSAAGLPPRRVAARTASPRLAPHRSPEPGAEPGGHPAAIGPGVGGLGRFLPEAGGGPRAFVLAHRPPTSTPTGPAPRCPRSPPGPGRWCRETQTVSLGHRSDRAEGSKGLAYFFSLSLFSAR